MRLTIARKIALAVSAIVVLCIGTMAWLTSANLQRGFVAYLNEMQAQDLDQVGGLLALRYKQEGGFEWLRDKPRAMKDVLDQMAPQLQMEADAPPQRRPPPIRRRGDRPPPRPGADGADGVPPSASGYGGRPPHSDDAPPPAYGGQPPPDDGAPPFPPGYGAPPRFGEDNGRPGRRPRPDPPPPVRGDNIPGDASPAADPPAGDQPADPPPRQNPLRDPMAFAQRLSVLDQQGRAIIGPRDTPPGIRRPIVVDGRTVGSVHLLQLRQASGANNSAAGFLRTQLRDILLLACALLLAAVALAAALARHLLRPVTALHGVTARLARGELAARAPVLSRDELGELALHVNAMAQDLERNEQQRRQVMADVSHELRTPLTVIRGEIEALLDGIRKADTGALDSLHGEVLRLTKLVDDLHQLALADAGDLHCELRELEWQALLPPLLERYRARAAAAGLELAWALGKVPVRIRGDAGRLEQVLINLLENSVRYTESGGRIAVVLALRGNHAELSIDDSAPGVPAGAHARLFERLYRVDQARTRERGGSGLGLSICKALVTAHGGEIAALPSTLGGVRIRLRLPLAP